MGFVHPLFYLPCGVILAGMQFENAYLLTLGDLKPKHVIRVSCGCRTMTLFQPVALKREHGLTDDTVILSLLGRFRCNRCRARNVVLLSVIDETHSTNSSLPIPETILFERGEG